MVEDLRFDCPRQAFERVQRISEFSEALYCTFMGPWVRTMANPWVAEAMQWLHPGISRSPQGSI
jgi:hypothetical protein